MKQKMRLSKPIGVAFIILPMLALFACAYIVKDIRVLLLYFVYIFVFFMVTD